MNCSRWAVRATVIGIGLVLQGASAQEPAEPPSARQESGLRAESDATHELFLVSLKALTLVVMSLAVPRELEARRRARLRAAQEAGAEQLDRRG